METEPMLSRTWIPSVISEVQVNLQVTVLKPLHGISNNVFWLTRAFNWTLHIKRGVVSCRLGYYATFKLVQRVPSTRSMYFTRGEKPLTTLITLCSTRQWIITAPSSHSQWGRTSNHFVLVSPQRSASKRLSIPAFSTKRQSEDVLSLSLGLALLFPNWCFFL